MKLIKNLVLQRDFFVKKGKIRRMFIPCRNKDVMYTMDLVFSNKDTGKKLDVSKMKIGDVQIQGTADLTVLMDGEYIQAVELHLHEGYYHPLHKHDNNESVGYVISGEIEMVAGDEKRILKAGDVWRHPKGVYHSTRALKDSYAVEMHSPRRKEYMMD